MKTIQLSMDEGIVEEMDEVVRELGTSRSAYVREILRQAFQQRRIKALEKLHEEGYRRYPVQPGEFDLSGKHMAWGDPWEEK